MNQRQITLLNLSGLLVNTAILLGALVLQLALYELPCPLCLLQRVGLTIVMFGFMLNVIYGTQARHKGVILLGALFGASVALRQVFLHIIPGTPGYGSALLGYHLYTWAFVVFAMNILGVAVISLLWNEKERVHTLSISGRVSCMIAMTVVLANVASALVECGPHLQCADNPVHYWLFSMTG